MNIFKKIFRFFKSLFKKPKNYASKGERLIATWLETNKIKFKPQYKVYLKEIARNSNIVYIDFMLFLNGKNIAIEYNGRQHYEYVPYFHKNGRLDFNKQLRRDRLVREWCKENEIILIEIPYTMSDKEILELLYKLTNDVNSNQ